MPYLGIKDSKKRIIEYLIGLETLSNEKKKNELSIEERTIRQEWGGIIREINSLCYRENCQVQGIPTEPQVMELGINSITNIVKNIEGGMLLDEYIASLQEEYDNLYSTEPKVADNYEEIEEELRLTEEAIATLEQQKREVHQKFMAENLAISKLNANLGTIRVDISNNKDAKKLRDLGAEIDSLSLKDICPVYHQKIQDALSARWNKYLEDREKVPKKKFSSDDDAKITTLRNVFIKNLRKFGYKSLTTMEQIEISKDSYLPVRENFDMKFDSSASDGIRAIWAFTLALMQTSI